MAGCCDPRGCDEFFSPRFARRMARRYRKRGIDKTARQMVEFLQRRGLDGAPPALPAVGTLIGKALENFDQPEGSIKVLVMTR